jgi:branched-chain amino acid aminotransferase
MNSRIGQREALRNGYDTCLFLNEFGKIAEGPGSCFFMVRNGTLITPSLTEGVLESITRDTVIKLAGMLGYPIVERTIDRTELYTAEEAFLCGSAMELRPVLSVDRYELTEEEGKMTAALHRAYLEAASGRNEDLLDWVTPIY